MQVGEHIDSFGCLLESVEFSFDGGSVWPREDFDKAQEWVKANTNEDGYLYPLITHRVRKTAKGDKRRRIPRTRRPARLFRIPPSHHIGLQSSTDQKTDRYGLEGFVVQGLAFLFGTKLQFWDWWVEGRIPTLTDTINICFHPSAVEKFFGRAVPSWMRLDDLNKKRLVNLLFVHSVAGAVEWDWQRHQLEYMVTDACYSIAEDLGKCKAKRHRDRLDVLCDSFGLARDEHWFGVFVQLRNGLFHEALWDGGQPFAGVSSESFFAPLHLRRFNHRLITALLCGPGEYTRTPWTFIDTYLFNID